MFTKGQAERLVSAFESIATELSGIKIQLKYLGTGDASTPMGAIECLSLSIKEGLGALSALGDIAESFNDGLNHLSIKTYDGLTYLGDSLEEGLLRASRESVGDSLGHEISMGIEHGLKNAGITGYSFSKE